MADESGTAVANSMVQLAIGLAEEPTANLDSATGISIMEMMIALTKNQRGTLIVATHDPELIALADRSIRLRDGRVADAP